MRQKVGKERSQGGSTPLGYPPLLPELGRANSSLRVPGRHPRRSAPGRRGRAMQSIANGSAKFSVRSSAQIFPLRTDTTLRTGLQLENRDRRSRAPPPPPAARGAARTRWVFCWFFFADFSHPADPVGVPVAPLFLEATQRKAERTAVAALRMEPAVAEVQVAGIGTRNGRRPTEPVDADAIQRTVVSVAVARGRCRVTPAMNHQQRNSASGAVPLGARFTRSLPAEDGDSASRDKFGKCSPTAYQGRNT